MFGSIAKLKLKPGSQQKMLDLVKGLEGRPVKGRVFNAVFQSYTDPDEVWSVVGFEDEATFRSYANHPHTAAMTSEWQQLLAVQPEWHGGQIVWDKRW